MFVLAVSVSFYVTGALHVSASSVSNIPATPENTPWLVSVTPFTEEQKQLQKEMQNSSLDNVDVLNRNNLTRGTNPPSTIFWLPSQNTYLSDAFSGKGTRYSGFIFARGLAGTYSGGNMSVAVYGDSFDVVFSDSGSVSSVYPGYNYTFNTSHPSLGGNGMFYFRTYDPVSGSKYQCTSW